MFTVLGIKLQSRYIEMGALSNLKGDSLNSTSTKIINKSADSKTVEFLKFGSIVKKY